MKILFFSLLLLIPFASFASPCSETDESEQWVLVTKGVDEFTMWKVDPNEIHSIAASNGFNLGVQIGPVSNEYYRKMLDRLDQEAVPEMVEI